MKAYSVIFICWILLCLGACTKETKQDTPVVVNPDNSETREVLLTLKNQLLLPKATKGEDIPAATKAGETIATAAENAISTLDVYAFAADIENGEYSFQERFAYRANPNDKLPAGATQLQLNSTGSDDKETTGLLKLKKGLFVKLYCIANDTAMIDPTHEGQPVGDAAFVPLELSASDHNKTKVTTPGLPLETAFASWHTHLLTATTAADTLATPLAMTGALTTPLDLTDFGSAARVQAGIRLTRLVARYDIINKAGTSRFNIETVSMGNARRGSSLFPIRPYGDMPQAKPDELITTPIRRFYGEKANNGNQTGAFYSYPSPIKDNGFLILKGMYKINESESKEVSYQVPFTQQTVNRGSTVLEINNNHRYILAISAADEYHLDCNITVADWTDDGKIDDYTPGIDTGKMNISIPNGDTETNYDADNHLVTMSLNAGTFFHMIMDKTSAMLPTMTKTYSGGLSAQEFDWLEITPPVATKSAPLTKAVSDDTAADGYKYTFALKDSYTKNRYPRAIIRFMNLTNGEETVLFVDALEAPRAMSTKQEGKDNYNIFDTDALEAEVYRLTDSNLRIKLFCSAGVELSDCPAWLTSERLSENNGESLYSFTLNDVAATPVDNKGEIIFKNTKYPDKTLKVTVKLIAPDIVPDFTQLGGDSHNSFTSATGNTPANITMRIAENNTFKFTSTSLRGINIEMNFNGGPSWLRHDGEIATKVGFASNTITFYLLKENLLGAKPATITLKNKTLGVGKDYVFTVTPDFVVPELTSATTMTLASKPDKKVPSIQITGNCYGGTSIVANESPEWLTYDAISTTANTFTYNVSLVPGDNKTNFPNTLPSDQTITLASAINPDKKTTVTICFTDQGWVEEEINQDEVYVNGNNPKTEYRVSTAGKTLTIIAYCMFAPPTVTTAYTSGYGNNSNWLPAPTAPASRGYGENRKKFTYQIAVPASSGTDAAYQLHQGTITLKQANTELKKITLWRGASNIPYPSGRSDNAYYSAVKKGGSWWAPINLGASEVAKNATNVSSIGKLYQWGRNVVTSYGSRAKTAGPTSNPNATDEFIAAGSDWLSTQNDYLWRDASGKKTSKDPCPNGWRVPISDELGKWGSGNWNNSTKILTISGENSLNLVLPAGGARYLDGSSVYQRTTGFFWSSSFSGSSGRRVTFSNGTVNADTDHRANALSIRCIKE